MKINGFPVSVIVTSYNQKWYLMEAIESVIRQTVRPYEIIIADDCSTDGSVEVIKQYLQEYDGWIKGVFQPKNVGIPKNRNAALRVVTGSHVSILDGDDLFRPTKIEREVEMITRNPQIGCVYSNVQIVDSIGRPMELRDNVSQPSGNIFAYIAKGKFGLLRSMLIDYSLLKEVGFMDETLPKYDGFELTVRLGKRTQFAYVQDSLVDYRVHPASDSRGLTGEDHLRDLEAIYGKILALSKDLTVDERNAILDAWNRIFYQFRVLSALEEKERMKALYISVSAWLRGLASVGEVSHMARGTLPEPFKKLFRQCRALFTDQKA